jgi:hypothetical protein
MFISLYVVKFGPGGTWYLLEYTTMKLCAGISTADEVIEVDEDTLELTDEEEKATTEADEPNEEEGNIIIANNAASTTTRSGRHVTAPSFLRDNRELGSISTAFDNQSWHIEQHEMMLELVVDF